MILSSQKSAQPAVGTLLVEVEVVEEVVDEDLVVEVVNVVEEDDLEVDEEVDEELEGVEVLVKLEEVVELEVPVLWLEWELELELELDELLLPVGFPELAVPVLDETTVPPDGLTPPVDPPVLVDFPEGLTPPVDPPVLLDFPDGLGEWDPDRVSVHGLDEVPAEHGGGGGGEGHVVTVLLTTTVTTGTLGGLVVRE